MAGRRGKLSERWYRRLLRLLPFDFRWEHGREMEQDFRFRQRMEEQKGGRAMGIVKLWWETLSDILRTAPREHLDMLLQDVRYALRTMRKNPGFTTVAVLTLALGIGANTAIFSVIYGVLLSPIPYPDSEELVAVWSRHTKGNWTRGGVSLQNYEDWRLRNQSFQDVGVFHVRGGNLSGGEVPRNVDYALVSPSFFRVFGVQPALGRWFTEDENVPAQDSVAIISDSLWRSAFGSAPDIVGKTLRLADRSLEIVGVMPAEFEYPEPRVQVWKPFGMNPDDGGPRGAHWAYVVGRRSSAVSLEQSQAEMDAIAAALEQEYPHSNENFGVFLEPLREAGVVDVRLALLVLWSAAGVVLLVACVNVANLLLVRGAARAKEIAVRVAMGAARARLVRQLLTESLLLALLGGAVGVLLAAWSLPVVVTIAGEALPRTGEIAVNGKVMAFSLALAGLTGLVFGLFPAANSMKANVQETLKEGGRGNSGRMGRKLSGALVVSEVALTLVLVVGASLLLQSFSRLWQEDIGFPTDHLLTFRVEPSMRVSSAGKSMAEFMPLFIRERGQVERFYDELVERIDTVPGVRSAAAVNRMPLSGNMWGVTVAVEGRPITSVEEKLFLNVRVVTDNYFRTLGVPLLRGRLLNEQDQSDTFPALVINQAAAEQYWPGEDPIGQRFTYEYPPEEANFWFTIVGVVGNVRHNTTSTPPSPIAYTPVSQALFGFFGNWGMDVLVRTSTNPLDLANAVRAQVQSLDSDLPAFRMLTMEQVMGRDLVSSRFNMILFSLFAGVALLLASVGVFGVISYLVSQQTHDFGIRMALGAQRSSIVRLVIGSGVRFALLGIGLGVIAAWVLSGFLSDLVYQVPVTDPFTLTGVSILMLVVALLACVIPARRAMKVDPMVALRYE